MGTLGHNYLSVIYITKWEKQQIDLCKRLEELFQYDEKQDCPELFEYKDRFDQLKEYELAANVLLFIEECASYVTAGLYSYFNRLKKKSIDFSMISKHKTIGLLIEKLCNASSLADVYSLINAFKDNTSFKIYRKELYYEMLRSLKNTIDYNDTIFNSASHIRKDVKLQRRYTRFKTFFQELCSLKV